MKTIAITCIDVLVAAALACCGSALIALAAQQLPGRDQQTSRQCGPEPAPQPGCEWIRVWRGSACHWECVPPR
jgi:hypothetical protein